MKKKPNKKIQKKVIRKVKVITKKINNLLVVAKNNSRLLNHTLLKYQDLKARYSNKKDSFNFIYEHKNGEVIVARFDTHKQASYLNNAKRNFSKKSIDKVIKRLKAKGIDFIRLKRKSDFNTNIYKSLYFKTSGVYGIDPNTNEPKLNYDSTGTFSFDREKKVLVSFVKHIDKQSLNNNRRTGEQVDMLLSTLVILNAKITSWLNRLTRPETLNNYFEEIDTESDYENLHGQTVIEALKTVAHEDIIQLLQDLVESDIVTNDYIKRVSKFIQLADDADDSSEWYKDFISYYNLNYSYFSSGTSDKVKREKLKNRFFLWYNQKKK